ncbi:sugar isomerase domain-containing protein [Pedococcus bigeumensis]|uniref:Sugar isomerase domain-containing protein n=1 Tax=Pedococcus bigeumensis TaxID=433644 RepID=A0A502D668_9MICO|nr:SIS domain-containing protein [Pedococcus bigeumensis]TPG19491.1 sugar isomerase domain-containing protein [Pedococcus bigeumensis]
MSHTEPGSPSPTPSGLSAAAFASMAARAVTQVAAAQTDAVARAARLMADSVEGGGVLQAFGTGHSEAFAMEIAGRAGGLIPTNRLALRDAVAAAGVDTDPEAAGLLERDASLAQHIYDLALGAEPQDVFLIASNSGGNGSIVELARLVRERGHKLVAVTSMDHTTRITSRHPSGLRLFEVADVVLDNGAPYGDAVLPLPGGGAACGISSITAALLAQMMVADTLALLLERGITPPVYLSANIPGGDEHNDELEARYAGRLRRLL